MVHWCSWSIDLKKPHQTKKNPQNNNIATEDDFSQPSLLV